MAKFSKSWNPRKRRIRRKPVFNERQDMAVKAQAIDNVDVYFRGEAER